MTAKEYLSQAYRLDQRITSKIEMLDSLNDLARKATSTLSGMPNNPSRSVSPMEDVICKIVDLQDEINGDVDTLINLKRDIARNIKTVDNIEYQMILEKRYISNKSWPEIAVELSYNLRHLYRMHDEALTKVVMPKNVTKCHY